MSPKAVDWALSTRGPRNASRLVLVVLASHAGGEDHEAWPGVQLIADEANVTVDTAQSALTKLIEAGYVEREIAVAPRRKGITRGPLRNLYRLRVGWTEQQTDGEWGVVPPTHSEPEWGAIFPANGGQSSGPMGGDFPDDDDSTPTSLNQQGTSIEPSAATAPERTTAQRADSIMKRTFDGIKRRTGKKPASLHPLAFKQMLNPIVEQYDDDEILRAIEQLWREGRPLIRQTIEAHIQGRAPARRNQPTLTDGLRALEFDADGNMIS